MGGKLIMYIPLNANVGCLDGGFGQSEYIIVNSAVPQVTHLVIKKTELPQREILVPIGWVYSTTMNLIHLYCSREELENRETCGKKSFIEACRSNQAVFLLNFPHAAFPSNMSPIKHKLNPPGSLIMQRRTYVKVTDGCAGPLDELVINPSDGVITHVVLGQGHFLGKKEVAIPISHVDRLEADTVYLKLDKRSLETLPSVKVWRRLIWKEKRFKLTNKVSIQSDGSSPGIIAFIHQNENEHWIFCNGKINLN